MPRFSGIAALNLVKTTNPELPFILVSGTVGEEVAVQAMQAGAQDYISQEKTWRGYPLRWSVSCGEAHARCVCDANARRSAIGACSSASRWGCSAPPGISGQIVEANPAFVQMLGFREVEELKHLDARIIVGACRASLRGATR